MAPPTGPLPSTFSVNSSSSAPSRPSLTIPASSIPIHFRHPAPASTYLFPRFTQSATTSPVDSEGDLPPRLVSAYGSQAQRQGYSTYSPATYASPYAQTSPYASTPAYAAGYALGGSQQQQYSPASTQYSPATVPPSSQLSTPYTYPSSSYGTPGMCGARAHSSTAYPPGSTAAAYPPGSTYPYTPAPYASAQSYASVPVPHAGYYGPPVPAAFANAGPPGLQASPVGRW